MRAPLAGLTLLCIVLVGCVENRTAFKVAEGGKPLACICLPEKPTEAEKNAAGELQVYLKKITGAEIPIVAEQDPTRNPVSSRNRVSGIYVGRTKALETRGASARHGFLVSDDDGFIIKTDGDAVLLCGKKDWGTEFAMYYFLQKYCGVRWFMPTELGEVVPQNPDLKLPQINERHEPDWKSRLYSGIAGEHAIWAKRNLMRGRYNFHHNLLNVIKASKYGKTHPEYFPLINGKRYVPTKDDDHSWQPCMSNPEVVKVCADAAREYFAKNPDAVSFSLGINDSNGYCQCDKCKAMDVPGAKFRDRPNMSDRVFAFMNAVAEELAKTNPDKYLGCLAYSWCEAVPTRVKVSPMIIPYLTNDRAQWRDGEFKAQDKKLIDQWTKADPNVSIYDYYYGSGYVIPRVHTRTIDESLKYCRSKSVKGFYAEIYPNWGLDGPKAWLTAQLLWKTDQSREKLLDEYYSKFFAEAPEPMRKYFEACEDAWMKQPGKAVWFKGFFQGDQMEIFPPERIAELEGYLNEAHRLAKQEVTWRRIEFVTTAFGYTKRFADMYWAGKTVANTTIKSMSDATTVAIAGAKVMTARRDLDRYYAEFIEKDLMQAPRLPFFERARYDPMEGVGAAFMSAAAWAEANGEWDEFVAELDKIEIASRTSLGAYASAVKYLHENKGKLANLLPNAGFEETQGKGPAPQGIDWESSNSPPGWSRWNRPGTEAEFKWCTEGAHAGKRCVMLKGSTAACYITHIPVKPGDRYYCSTFARATGSDRPEVKLLVQWQDAKGWVSKPPAGCPLKGPDRSAWTPLVTVFTVPDGATKAAIGLIVNEQQKEDAAWFDDVELYRIP